VKKKLVMLLVAVVVVVSLVVVGCAPKAAPPAPPAEEKPAPPAEEKPAPAAPEAKVYKLDWQDISPIGSSMYIILQTLVDRVRTASGGRLDITLHPEGELTPRDETTPAVRDGAIDMATNSSPMDLGRMGNVTYLMGSSGLPAGPSSADLLAWLYQGGGLEIENEVYKDWGYVIGAQPGSAELFCHSNKPLQTAKDFKGLKFRTLGLWAEILKGYGVSVVMIPGGELYQAVQTGVLDAFELGPPSYNWPSGFQEILKYIGVPGIQSPGFTNNVLVNKDSWNSLPPDLQQLLKDEIEAMTAYGQLYLLEADSEAMAKYIAYGTKIFTVDEAFQAEIAAKSKALLEGYCVGDPVFTMVWENQTAFFKKWHSLTGIVPKYTIFD
jgi:TRAP-type mannitol/chloroaromatic compound transport system substrate-binding protein